MGTMSLLISILAFGLSCFVFGYYVGTYMMSKVVDAHREFEDELKRQRDDYKSRFNYLAYGNSDGMITLVRKE